MLCGIKWETLYYLMLLVNEIMMHYDVFSEQYLM